MSNKLLRIGGKDPAGNARPFSVSDGGNAIVELEEWAALMDKIDDLATDNSLGQLLSKLSNDPSTAAKQDLIKGVLDTIALKDYATQTTLLEVKNELISLKNKLDEVEANQLSGDQKVQLSGHMMERFGATVDERPPADSVPVGAAFVAVRTMNVWISDGSAWQEVA